jgi:hypothetical protein
MSPSEIDDHIRAIGRLHEEWPRNHAAQRASHHETWQHYTALMRAYGDIRGWVAADSGFSVRDVARVSGADEEWDREFADHKSFWLREGRPYAVAAHLYGCDQDRKAAARAWAARRGLVASFPDDFPSWWLPGRTTLIEITCARGANRLRPSPRLKLGCNGPSVRPPLHPV